MNSIVDYGYDSGSSADSPHSDRRGEPCAPPSLPKDGDTTTPPLSDLDERMASVSPNCVMTTASDTFTRGGSYRRAKRTEGCEAVQGQNEDEEDEEDDLMPKVPECRPRPDILEQIKKFHQLRAKGKTLNEEITRKREFLNPYLLERTMAIFSIDPYCSNFPRDIYDPSLVARHPDEYYDKKFERIDRLKLKSSRSAARRGAFAQNNNSTTIQTKPNVARPPGASHARSRWDIPAQPAPPPPPPPPPSAPAAPPWDLTQFNF